MNLILRNQLDLIQMHFSACVSIDWKFGASRLTGWETEG